MRQQRKGAHIRCGRANQDGNKGESHGFCSFICPWLEEEMNEMNEMEVCDPNDPTRHGREFLPRGTCTLSQRHKCRIVTPVTTN